MKTVNLYVLYDSITLRIRYIGITEKNLQLRLKGHLNDAIYNTSNSYKCRWILKAKANGADICIRKIATFSSRYEAEKIENDLIEKYKKKHNLLNCLDLGRFRNTGKKSAENLKSKKIYMYSLKGEFIMEFPSLKDTAKYLGLERHAITKVLTGKKISTKENQFSYSKVEKMPDVSHDKKIRVTKRRTKI